MLPVLTVTDCRLHHGTPSQQEVEMAGSRSDLGGLAWVECKHCRYRGMGLGGETLRHSRQHQVETGALQILYNDWWSLSMLVPRSRP